MSGWVVASDRDGGDLEALYRQKMSLSSRMIFCLSHQLSLELDTSDLITTSVWIFLYLAWGTLR